jgi:hypothetical protein
MGQRRRARHVAAASDSKRAARANPIERPFGIRSGSWPASSSAKPDCSRQGAKTQEEQGYAGKSADATKPSPDALPLDAARQAVVNVVLV